MAIFPASVVIREEASVLKTAGRRPSFPLRPWQSSLGALHDIRAPRGEQQAAYTMLPALLRTHTRGILGREEMFDTDLSWESCCWNTVFILGERFKEYKTRITVRSAWEWFLICIIFRF